MLWHVYALLSHGRDRLGLRPQPYHGRSQPLNRPDEVLRILERIDEAVWSASALAACAESGLIQRLVGSSSVPELARDLSLHPVLVENLVDHLAGFGLVLRDGEHVRASPALLPFTTTEGSAIFRAALRAPHLQSEDFRRRLAAGALDLDGWTHTDAAIIEAQGALTGLWAQKAIPKLKYLPGLVNRLGAPRSALLDVGAGAAGLSIALCRAFPRLDAVALEPAPHPAAIGERLVREAGLESRILFRRQRIEHFSEREAFDLAFLPQMFLADTIIDDALRQTFDALRPGGWLLVAVLAREGIDRTAAVTRLKSLLWGGNTRSMDAMAPRVAAAGFSPVIRAPGGGTIRMICARRPARRLPALK